MRGSACLQGRESGADVEVLTHNLDEADTETSGHSKGRVAKQDRRSKNGRPPRACSTEAKGLWSCASSKDILGSI